MLRDELAAFMVVAEEKSFTRAAARLSTSQPALNQTVRRREGKLVRVLAEWCAPFAGYHIYYPSRHLLSPAFQVLLQTLRRRNAAEEKPRRPVIDGNNQ